MSYFFQNLKNVIDFSLRQKIKLSRKNYSEANESKDNLFESQSEKDQEKYLYDKYKLDYLKENTTRTNYIENLYIIDILDQYLNVSFSNQVKIIDVGSKNWFYAKGEYLFFKRHCKNFVLNGIELDVNRLYSNFFSRNEVAKFHIKNLNNLNYISGDFIEHNQKYDYIIWILPFVLEYPHFKWGLPHNYFKPKEMLKHAYDILNESGQIIIINQGEAEYETQKRLCLDLNIKFEEIGLIKSLFSTHKKERYLIIIKK